MKYATIDAQGNPTAFYDSEIHGEVKGPDPNFKPGEGETEADAPIIVLKASSIPPDAVEIPESVWQAHINGQRKVYDSASGAWVDYAPSADELLNQAKTSKLAELKTAYESAISADIAYMNTTFQADQKSQDTITKVLAASGGALPDGFFWLDAANNQVPMTFADLQGLANAILLRGQQLFAKYQQLKAQVNAATTVAEVGAVVW